MSRIPRGRLRRAAQIGGVTAATCLASAVPAHGFTYVVAANGQPWGVHDAAAPAVDTGSIKYVGTPLNSQSTASPLSGYGGIRVRVSGSPGGRAGLMNGELMRGFGLRFDGLDRFRTTKSVELGGVSMARSIYVNRNANWARWLDSFTNTSDTTVVAEVVFGGQTGVGAAGNQLPIVETSSGDTAVTAADSWALSARPAGPSAAAPSAAVLGASGSSITQTANWLRDSFDTPMATAGHEANFHGYATRLTLAPGETETLLRYVVIGRAETAATAGTEVAAVRTEAAALAAAPPVDDLSQAELCALRNWDPAALGASPAGCADVDPVRLIPAPDQPDLTTSSAYDVFGKSIGELQADMEAGRTTSQEIVRAYLDRIRAYDTGQWGFNAYTTVAADAMAQARRADVDRANGRRGALLGIPVAVKDLYDTKDMATTNGSFVFEGFRPTKDATQVAQLREAGAIILGKASMEEYATSGSYSDSAFGQVWNAFDPSKSALASSGGSGVAVATSMAAFALGSQTGDSLYAPAAASSLVTLRGTDGMQSAYGVMPLVWLQDYPGAMTRTVSDLADVLNVTTGTDPKDPMTAEADRRRPADWRAVLDTDALRGARIGWYPAAFTDPYGTTGTVDASRAQLAHFAAAGAQLVEIAAPPAAPPTPAGGFGDRTYEGWERWLADHPEAPYDSATEIMTSPKRLAYMRRDPATYTGAPMTASQVAAWKQYRKDYAALLGRWMDDNDVDAVAYPSLLSDISLNDSGKGSFGRRDTPSGGSGTPTVAIPAGRNDHGEPINLQLLGRSWSDAMLVGYAYAFEQVAKGQVLPDTAPRLEYQEGLTPRPIVIERPAPPSGGSGAQPTPTTPATPAAPAWRVRASVAASAAVRGGRARVVVRNTGARAVSGKVVLRARLTVRGRARTVTIGSAAVRIPATASRTVAVRLSGAARRALRRRSRLATTAVITLRVSGGEARTISRRVTLKR